MKYFKPSEFKRCTPSCEISQMDTDFLELLDKVREDAGVPFVLLSAYRNPSHDMTRGRTGKGYHTLGRAVDVSCMNGNIRLIMIKACISLGLSVGVYPTFLHIDNRSNQVVFYGK